MKKFWLLFAFAVLFPFQNCAQGGGASSYGMLNQNSSSANCATNPQTCLNPGSGNANALQLRLNSWATQNVSSTSTGITIAGTCADGGFAATRIYWELDDAAGNVHNTSLLSGYLTGCIQGVFSANISGFVTALGAARFVSGTQLQVRFLLNGVSEQGSPIYPTNTAQASAIKPLSITP